MSLFPRQPRVVSFLRVTTPSQGAPDGRAGAAARRFLGGKGGVTVAALLMATVLVFGVASGSATGPADSYTAVAFSDGFESGNLASWNGLLGNGTAAVEAAAAHAGAYGLRLSNAAGQFQVAQ